MRKLVVLSCVLLSVSGLLLVYSDWLPWVKQNTVTALLHIWIGFFFVVIFPMYSWDHILRHRNRLHKWSWVSTTGIIQLAAALGLIGSGIVLLLYGTDTLALPRDLHELLTYILAVSLILHSFAPK